MANSLSGFGLRNPSTIDKGMWPGWSYKATKSGKGDLTSTKYEYFPPSSKTAATATPGASPGDLNKEYLGIYNKFGSPKAGQVEGGAAQGLFYNPTGKAGGFQSLTSEALSDPTVYGNVTAMFKDPTADKAWGDVLGKYNPAALKTPGGSTHGVTDEVLKKMWT
jgi:hypothetical protein